MKINSFKIEGHFRQGDVGLTKTDKSTKRLTEIMPMNERVVLALGEVTGHHHSIDLLKTPGVKLWKFDENVNILSIPAGGATIEHQEHGSIFIPEGDYESHIQIEYDPEGNRKVTD